MIDDFHGEHYYLSNFYPCIVKYEGQTYSSSEHAFQAAKSIDESVREKFREPMSPGQAKKLGRKIKLRSDWEQVKLQVMEDVVLDKFTRNADLKKYLLATGDEELIEGNDWGDKTWGMVDGKGENHLGKILMKIRKKLEND